MKFKYKLSQEALLFDSPLYILKAFIGVFLAYAIFSQHPFVGKDMISVLFAMMLTLEPISVIGLHSGIAQVKGTLLGGLVGFLVVSIGGVTIWTVPLAVAITLYIALVMDWRVVPAVAIFTSIYMTQYIQYDGLGNPDMLMTLALRMSALGSGILVAVIVNSVFSKLGYRRMISKRLVFTLQELQKLLDHPKNFRQTDFSIALVPILNQLTSIDKDLTNVTIFGHENLKNKYQNLVRIMILLTYEIRAFALNVNSTKEVDESLKHISNALICAMSLLKDQKECREIFELENIDAADVGGHLMMLIGTIEEIKTLERS